MKRSSLFLINLWVLVMLPGIPLLANGSNDDLSPDFAIDICLEDSLEQALIIEGKRQLNRLMEYNAKNEAEGCPEDNVYFFSLIDDDDWIKTIQLQPEATVDGFLSEGSLVEMNNKLIEVNTETDKAIYVCMISHLPVDVDIFFSEQITVTRLIDKYNELSVGDNGRESAQTIGRLKKKYDGILQEIMSGDSEHMIGAGAAYNSFVINPNRCLLAAGKFFFRAIHPTAEGEKLTSSRIMRTVGNVGYFREHKDKIKTYLKTYTYEGTNLERDIAALSNFVVTKQHSDTEAREVLKVDNVVDLAAFSLEQPVNPSPPSINAENVYVFDFANLYREGPALKDSLREILSGTAVGFDTKMKLYITNPNVAQNYIDDIQNLDVTASEHENTMFVWVHILESGEMEYVVRYSPELRRKVGNFFKGREIERIQRENLERIRNSPPMKLFQLQMKALFVSSGFLVKLIEDHGEISAKYYRKDSSIYDPIGKYAFTLLNPSLIVDDLFSSVSGEVEFEYDGNIQPSDVQFALYCGVYNGLVSEVKDIIGLVKLASGSMVDKTTQENLNKMLKTLGEGKVTEMIWKTLKHAHTGPPCKVAHQIGKDAIIILTTMIPLVGQAAKITKLSKLKNLSQVCINIGRATDMMNILFKSFKTAGFAIKRAQGGAILIGKQIGNQMTTYMTLAANKLTIPKDFYSGNLTKAKAALNVTSVDELSVAQRIIFPSDGSMVLAVSKDGGSTNVAGTVDGVEWVKNVDGDMRAMPLVSSHERLAANAAKLSSQFPDGIRLEQLFGNNKAGEIISDIKKLDPIDNLVSPEITSKLLEIKNAGGEETVKRFFLDIQKAAKNEVDSKHFGYYLEDLTVAKVDAYNVMDNIPGDAIKAYRADNDVMGRLGNDLDGNSALRDFITQNGENGLLAWKYADDAYPNRPWCFN